MRSGISVVAKKNRHDSRDLILGFVESMERFPSRPALEVGGACLTYAALGRIAGDIAATIKEHDRESDALVPLLAHRSLVAYAGVLGILGAGKGYVPLNPKLPAERLLRILAQSNSHILIVAGEYIGALEALLPHLSGSCTILLPNVADPGDLPDRFVQHRFILPGNMARGSSLTIPARRDDPIAYLLFTSGSTGDPKGVAVRHGNVIAYLRYICDQYQVDETDRFSQMFDLTFDLSVHDLFACWERGACLCSVPEHSVMAPAKFIQNQRITMWFSVPSVVGVMSKLGMLKPGCFPSLRASLFCGEPLPAIYAEAWQHAAPHSVVENLYGPTETTIAITHYRWKAETSPVACRNRIVPIGQVFDGQATCVVDADLNPVGQDANGELCLSGDQVTQGYWHNWEKTNQQFIRLPDHGETIWYRTGDLVTQDEQGCLYYLGRIDNQVKIRGYRVELQEIDCVISHASGTQEVASIAWPVRDGIAEGIVSFVCGGPELDTRGIVGRCREVLPDYMVPRKIYVVDALPLTIHGKTDRLKLRRMLEDYAS